MQILKGLKEQALDQLSYTNGEHLDISCNLSTGNQIRYLMESHAHSYLGSAYIRDRSDLMKRLTCSYQGRHRNDVVAIGSSSTEGGVFGGAIE